MGKKRITITVDDADVIKVLSPIFNNKIDADFSVETIGEVETKVVRHVASIYRGEKKSKDLITDYLLETKAGYALKSELQTLLVSKGYAEGTITPTLSDLHKHGVIERDRDRVWLKKKDA